ncbi:hypothetical protein EVAR_36812_1 [Eumeta japonica]|uniref:Uncharacterized protein n=1 Tax=Eumeta variegata TaxID=151549 RepID=A0A4C1WYR1_EUMVA|nr:hypothetical protein EVAR_36812_1 [Eumeta japonica]
MVYTPHGYPQFQRSYRCIADLLGGNTMSNESSIEDPLAILFYEYGYMDRNVLKRHFETSSDSARSIRAYKSEEKVRSRPRNTATAPSRLIIARAVERFINGDSLSTTMHKIQNLHIQSRGGGGARRAPAAPAGAGQRCQRNARRFIFGDATNRPSRD